MKRKTLISVIVVAAAVLVLAAAAVWYFRSSEASGEPTQQEHPTDSWFIFRTKTPHADPVLVGKWQNKDNPKWYKVYYDDYDEKEKMFWGKEWNEAEDVCEEDLGFHGNGWFRWKKEGKYLSEYATMDIRDVPIHRTYKLKHFSADSLVYFEENYKKRVFRFGKQ